MFPVALTNPAIISDSLTAANNDNEHAIVITSDEGYISGQNSTSTIPTSMQALLPYTSESDMDGDFDIDAYTSEDGGVELSLGDTGLYNLNSELEVHNGEVAIPHNMAAIATSTSIAAALDNMDTNYQASLQFGDENHNVEGTFSEPNDTSDQPLVELEHSNVLADVTMGINHVTTHLQELQALQFEAGGLALMHTDATMAIGVEQHQRNLSLGDFLETWAMADAYRSSTPRKRKRCPNMYYIEELRNDKKVREIKRADLRNEKCDFQGINWEKLEVSRADGRMVRQQDYKSYFNTHPPKYHSETLRKSKIDDSQNYFKFRRMDLAHKPHYAHFQLRNLLACTSQNSVYYAGRSKVYQTQPLFANTRHVKMDLTDPYVTPADPAANTGTGMLITTIAAKHGVLLSGGFGGEYALTSTNTSPVDHTEGLITHSDNNAITNHIDIIQSRLSYSPQAVFACNDMGIRILDTQTETIIHEQIFDWPVNCTATSPDSRLRVAVADTREAYILNAETSEVLQVLHGHEDFGFACAWADNGYHVATGNQDKLVKIWDARMWNDSHGNSKPLTTISMNLTCPRSLHFSPVGSGKRVLVAAEQADMIQIIDAETYDTKQQLDFFGEITGTAFSPDGQDLFVGVEDAWRGGIMDFERCGRGENYSSRRLAWGKRRYHEADEVDAKWISGDDGELESQDPANAYEVMDSGFDWKPTIAESTHQRKAKRTTTWYRRRAAGLGDEMPLY